VALLGNDPMPASVNASVTIVPGPSSPSNSKFFVPNLLNVSAGTTVTWTNGDLTSYKSFEVEQLHTVTSGTLEKRAIGIEFDSGLAQETYSSILLIRQEHLITSVQSILS
jgi:plastocyanin